jgi:hypothetical protein
MLTQETIDKFYKDVESLKIKKKGAVITKATGFPKSNVSEYLRKIKTPSENFIIAFYENFDKFLPKSSTNVTTDADQDTTYAVPQIAKDLAELNKALPMGDLKVTLRDYIELWKMLYTKEEERGKELVSIIKDLAKGQNEIKEVLKPLKEKTEAIEANSKTIISNLARVEHLTRADDLSMMEGTDKILGRESGATATEAGTFELVLGASDEDIDTTISSDKPDSSGKETQQET